MVFKLARLSVVLLVFSSLVLRQVQASSLQSTGTPAGKARYYPLARDYRQRILDKIEAPSLVSASLPLSQLAYFSPDSFRQDDARNGRRFSGDNPSDLLMSLQP